MKGELDRSRSAQPRLHDRAARLLVAVYAAGTGLSVLLWLSTRWSARHGTWLELAFGVINIPLSHSLVSVVVLALITRALIGRKRAGLVAVAGFQVLGMYLGVVAAARLSTAPVPGPWVARQLFGRTLDVVSLLVGAFVLVWLWRLRRDFPGHLRRGSWWRLAAVSAAGLTLTVSVTWALVTLTETLPAGSQWQQLLGVLERSVGDVDADTARDLTGVVPWLPELTSILLSATVLAAVAVFLRSADLPTAWSGDREVGLRRLLAADPQPDSLGYFATRRDKDSIFSRDGRAAVTYRVRHGVSLASGDPVGDPSAWSAAVAAWKDEARYYGWTPAVVAASEGGARCYAAAGLSVLGLGDEAILPADRFAVNSVGLSSVRQAVRRAERSGITVTVRRQDQISDDELTAVGAAADAWRGGEPDRGYSMALNRFADPADVNTVYAVAHDHTGDAVGVLSLVPWGRHGLSLDVMRRRPDAPNGTTEAMVTAVMSAAPGLGISHVSLNFCMFRHVYADAEGIGAGSVTRFNYSVLGVLDRFWQFQRLYRANQKYQPQWRPRYLCFDGRVALPQVIFAVAAAEGFLPRFPTRHRHTGPQLSDEHLDQLRELDTAPPPEPSRRLPARSDQTRQRLRRLPALEAAGQPPYPIGLPEPTHQLGDLDRCDDPAGHPEPIRVAGRIRSIRDHGGAVFATLVDGSASAQVLLERDRLGSRPVRTFARLLDRGDLIVIDGHRGRSRTGTPTLFVERWRLAAKALHPVPFAHFSDPETRLRQRSTDLLVHPDQKRLLRQRSTAVRALRATLETEGFLEVETPILHTVHGGATARPFTTFINAYGVDLTLRIAPELYLKRLLVGGLGPLFELGRNFRNEGADATHNPEFTSLEAYLPYADYTTMRHLTVRLITAAAIAVHGRPILPLVHRDGATRPFDLTREWAVVPMLDAVSAALHHHVDLDTDIRHLVDHAHRHGVAVRPGMGRGAILEQLYADLVERVTIEPTFFTDFPAETSPLTGPHRSHPGLVERWDLVIGAMEIGTAYSELTDPVEQRRRLTEQSRQAAAGDPAAMVIDEDFLHALETGMPPSGGLGLGVDRIVMLLTGGNIRSVLTFPFVRPR